jgi:folate-binding protein YgfZ
VTSAGLEDAGPWVADLSERGKLALTGPQALWFLDQLITNQVVGLPAGAGQEALLLTPKGRIIAPLRVLATESEVLVDTDQGLEGPMLAFFNGRVFTTKVQIRDATADYGLLRVFGPGAEGAVQAALGAQELPQQEHEVIGVDAGYVVAIQRPFPGFDLWVRPSDTADVAAKVESSGAVRIDDEDYERARIVGGIPRYGLDYDDGYLPQEAAMERAVHFKKGCYLGQEAVAMTQRGKIKRRLRHLRFAGSPVTGSITVKDQVIGVDAGTVTSAAAFGPGSFGIASVKTTVSAGDRVVVAGADGTAAEAGVEELPGAVSGPSVPSARELRERLQQGAART